MQKLKLWRYLLLCAQIYFTFYYSFFFFFPSISTIFTSFLLLLFLCVFALFCVVVVVLAEAVLLFHVRDIYTHAVLLMLWPFSINLFSFASQSSPVFFDSFHSFSLYGRSFSPPFPHLSLQSLSLSLAFWLFSPVSALYYHHHHHW